MRFEPDRRKGGKGGAGVPGGNFGAERSNKLADGETQHQALAGAVNVSAVREMKSKNGVLHFYAYYKYA